MIRKCSGSSSQDKCVNKLLILWKFRAIHRKTVSGCDIFVKLYKTPGLTFPGAETTIPYGSKIISEERGGTIMEKILAVAIFVVMFALIIWDRFPRQ